MANTVTYDDKFHRKYAIQSAGDVLDQGSKLESGIGNLLTVENHLRVSTEGLGAANSIEVRARMLDESTWTTLKSISGNETQIIDITTYEVVHFFVSTYDSTPGFISMPPILLRFIPWKNHYYQLISDLVNHD